MERHLDRISDLRRAILDTPGDAGHGERSAAEAGERTDTPADVYLDKVRRESHRITDADIDSLREAGLSEDAIFELTLATALGEATRRLNRALKALAATRAPDTG